MFETNIVQTTTTVTAKKTKKQREFTKRFSNGSNIEHSFMN